MVPLDHAMYKYYLYTARCTLFFGHKWNGTIRSVYHNFAHALLFVSCDKLEESNKKLTEESNLIFQKYLGEKLKVLACSV